MMFLLEDGSTVRILDDENENNSFIQNEHVTDDIEYDEENQFDEKNSTNNNENSRIEDGFNSEEQAPAKCKCDFEISQVIERITGMENQMKNLVNYNKCLKTESNGKTEKMIDQLCSIESKQDLILDKIQTFMLSAHGTQSTVIIDAAFSPKLNLRTLSDIDELNTELRDDLTLRNAYVSKRKHF